MYGGIKLTLFIAERLMCKASRQASLTVSMDDYFLFHELRLAKRGILIKRNFVIIF